MGYPIRKKLLKQGGSFNLPLTGALREFFTPSVGDELDIIVEADHIIVKRPRPGLKAFSDD